MAEVTTLGLSPQRGCGVYRVLKILKAANNKVVALKSKMRIVSQR